MKIDEAIKIHKMWKSRISDYISNPDKSLRPEACHERCCELSKWMNSEEAMAYYNTPEFLEIQKAHKAFHHALAELVLNVNKGVPVSEEMALGIDSPFNRYSENLVRNLSKLKSKQNIAA